ncbi:MAG: hypothetical protein ACI8YO_002902, partial [Gammaproteobacteria bacterium]
KFTQERLLLLYIALVAQPNNLFNYLRILIS